MAFFLSQNSWSIVGAYLAIVFLLLNSVIGGDDPVEIEKGAVVWSTDFESAKQEAVRSGRPVFLLFQEIPG